MRSFSVLALFSIVVAFTIIGTFGISNAFAYDNGYKMIDDVTPVLTFTFRDGVETHSFPVFDMGENFVDDDGVSFYVEGNVEKSPLLHKALDEAYKYRFSNNAFDYQFKYFDVDVEFVKNDQSIISFDYNNCRIGNYQIETLDSNDAESFFAKVGFAIVDKINFVCSGVNFNDEFTIPAKKFTDFGSSGFNFANEMRTVITFSFNDGYEKIEFPEFDLISAYSESDNNIVSEFNVGGVLEYYPLLYKAIDDARSVSGGSYSNNEDFDALVEFTDGTQTLRGLDFKKCLVRDAQIDTLTDKEEGFIGKGAFVVTHQLGFTCSGLKPINDLYDNLRGDSPSWKVSKLHHTYHEPIDNTAKELEVIATFTFADGIEEIEFSMFKQAEVLTSTVNVNNENGDADVAAQKFTRKTVAPTFEMRGIAGNYPMLYKHVDDGIKIQSVKGTQMKNLADIDIEILSDGQVIRGFNYSDCRAIDYRFVTQTGSSPEESYTKSQFALVNIFDFECLGYHPNNPIYDAMFVIPKADNTSTNDLRNTDRWERGFFVD